jgi:hypothetical protein
MHMHDVTVLIDTSLLLWHSAHIQAASAEVPVQHVPGQDYKHRCNKDGSFDSICLYCYQTIASAQFEVELLRGEQTHFCYLKKQPSPAPFEYLRTKYGDHRVR